jgi:GH25 family lysozyme M1 (1,4-beta-N-acetylmuramidase)
MAQATVSGIDVNDYRGDIDWHKVVAAGHRFAFVKTTEGLDYRDKCFGPKRWQAMREAKIIRGAYHFARPQHGRRGRDEAQFFLSVLDEAGGRKSGDLPLVLDVEWPKTPLRGAELRDWCSDFCTTVRQATGRGCLVYTGNFWHEFVRLGPPKNGSNLWYAIYGPDDARTRVDPRSHVPAGYRLLMHQWTSKGQVSGVQKGPVDLNVWFGTLAELRALCRDPKAGRPGARPRPQPATSTPAPGTAKPRRMTTEDIQHALQQIGWPVADDGDYGAKTTEAVKDFQRGYLLETLPVNGKAGPKTRQALRACVAGGGRCSRHFTFKEFASKGDGWIKVDRALVRGLERYRRRLGRPVTVVSGYRDPAHNASVGGKSQSQHLFGNGVDIPPVLSTEEVKALRVFSGIGYQQGSGLVRHVDVRHRGPNTTRGTLAAPTTWLYT